MAKILVVEDEKDIRNLLMDILDEAGYEVAEALDGEDALEKVATYQPDLMILDLMMPIMDGFEVMSRLRQAAPASDLPIVVLSAVPSRQGELRSWELGVRHYIPKPFEAERVQLSVKIALREAVEARQASAETGLGANGTSDGAGIRDLPTTDAHQDAAEQTPCATEADRDTAERAARAAERDRGVAEQDDRIGQSPSSASQHLQTDEQGTVFRTGDRVLNQILGGGIRRRSLALIEGISSSGKSVLCQHIAYEALRDGQGVAFFASDKTTRDLVEQMGSIGMNVADYLRAKSLSVFNLAQPMIDDKYEWSVSPEKLMTSLIQDIQSLPDRCSIAVLDDISDLLGYGKEASVLRFVSQCRRLCHDGRTVIVATQSDAINGKMRAHMHESCDVHINLQEKQIGRRTGIILEVRKPPSADPNIHNTIAFKVAPGVGIQRLNIARIEI